MHIYIYKIYTYLYGTDSNSKSSSTFGSQMNRKHKPTDVVTILPSPPPVLIFLLPSHPTPLCYNGMLHFYLECLVKFDTKIRTL